MQQTFAKRSKSFEEEAIAFTNKGQKDALRIPTFFLMSSHGALSEQVYYAKLIEDYHCVLSFFVTEQDYEGALKILDKFCKPRQYEECFYKFAPVLMQHLPVK